MFLAPLWAVKETLGNQYCLIHSSRARTQTKLGGSRNDGIHLLRPAEVLDIGVSALQTWLPACCELTWPNRPSPPDKWHESYRLLIWPLISTSPLLSIFFYKIADHLPGLHGWYPFGAHLREKKPEACRS